MYSPDHNLFIRLVKANVVSSKIHGYSYSIIACQAAYLATYFPSVCWNTAYLRVISGLDMEDATNYGKVAKGIGEMINHGIEVKPVDINKSGYMFDADVENNAILYGMKGLNGVNTDAINEIIENRPYKNMNDFVEKVADKTAIITLIKAGAIPTKDKMLSLKKYANSLFEKKEYKPVKTRRERRLAMKLKRTAEPN